MHPFVAPGSLAHPLSLARELHMVSIPWAIDETTADLKELIESP